MKRKSEGNGQIAPAARHSLDDCDRLLEGNFSSPCYYSVQLMGTEGPILRLFLRVTLFRVNATPTIPL